MTSLCCSSEFFNSSGSVTCWTRYCRLDSKKGRISSGRVSTALLVIRRSAFSPQPKEEGRLTRRIRVSAPKPAQSRRNISEPPPSHFEQAAYWRWKERCDGGRRKNTAPGQLPARQKSEASFRLLDSPSG